MPVASIELVTKTEYARRRGCTEAAVRRAVRDGRITLIDGRIDPVAADAQWARNTRVRAGSRGTDDANLSGSGASGGRAGDAGDDSEDAADGYWKSRARRELAEADMAELKLAEQRGLLVRAADIRAAQSRRLAALREALLQLPARLAPVLAAEADAGKVHEQLQAELHQVLAHMTEAPA